MRHWFGVSAKAALSTRLTQFINHANLKIIYSHVMDWANVTEIYKYTLLSSMWQTLFPLDEHALYKDNLATWDANQKERDLCGRECQGWRAIESHCWPPEICIGIALDFSWDNFMSQEKLQTIEVYYGIWKNSLENRIGHWSNSLLAQSHNTPLLPPKKFAWALF